MKEENKEPLNDGQKTSLLEGIRTEQFQHYTIKELHATGGIGKIFLAFDKGIERNIAIKELSLDSDRNISRSEDLRSMETRFLREAKITGQLEHPSIIPVYEIGYTESNTLYYTMKLVKGETFTEAIQSAEILKERLKLLPHFRDLCNAVSYAHSKGVIHRDIKPQNVMIGNFGETVLIDWGLAKIKGEKTEAVDFAKELAHLKEFNVEKTIAGAALGTPAYMSPEQALGDTESIDELSDIYSLGAVLYEILSGRSPFKGTSALKIIDKVKKGKPPPLQYLDTEIPQELIAVTEKAMHKDKKNRYQSSVEMARDIEAYMSGEKVGAHEYSTMDIFSMFLNKNKILVGSIVAIIVILIVSLIEINLQYQESIAQRMIAEDNERIAKYNFAQSLNREAENLLIEKRFAEANIYAAASLLYNPSNEKSPYFDPDFERKRPQSIEFKTLAYSKIYASKFGISLKLETIFKGNEFWDIAFSPDGSMIAGARNDKTVTIWDIENEQEIVTLKGHKNRVRSIAFSPDGKMLVSGSKDRTVKLWNVSSGKEIYTFNGHKESVMSVAISPNGKIIASGGNDNLVKLWNVKTGKEIMTHSGHKEGIPSIAFSPDGNIVASGSFDRTIKLWKVQNGNIITTLKGHSAYVRGITFSPDGKTLASASYDKTIKLWNVSNGTNLTTLKSQKDFIYSVAFSPDEKMLANGSSDKTIHLWNIKNRKEILRLHAHKEPLWSAAFSPNGNIFASSSFDKTIKLWKINRGNEIPTFTGHTSSVLSVNFSPDSKRIVTCSYDKTVRLWSTDKVKEILSFKGHSDVASDVEFSPDGKMVATSSFDQTAKLWNAETGKETATFTGHKDNVLNVAFSPDGTILATGSSDKTIKLWNTNNKKNIATLKGHTANVWILQFSPDGKTLASGSSDNTVKLWNVKTKKEIATLPHKDWMTGLAFSKNNTILYATGKDAKIYHWNLHTRELMKIYIGHNAWINSIKLSPDEKYLLTSSDDQTVRIWDVATTKTLLTIQTERGYGIDFSHDGKSIIIGDKTVMRIYPLDFSHLGKDPVKLLKQAENSIGKYLDGFELKQMSKEDFERRKEHNHIDGK